MFTPQHTRLIHPMRPLVPVFLSLRFPCSLGSPLIGSHFGLLRSCDWYQPDINRGQIIMQLCLHFIIHKAAMELEQFRCGLESLGVLQMMEKHPHTFIKAFRTKPTITLDIFKSFILNTLIKGRKKMSSSKTGSSSWVTSNKVTWNLTLVLASFFAFLTGCDHIPPLVYGDEIPQINFSNE